ncbi:PAQR family membrane homeostasis protein TrhA [Hansschlegelia zhihuaiae]|uniref:Hemolysin III family protein n=1 Tax=Hansschlegelia zhihuaiae TaxID=405005 RepID=A0A4Q0M2M2_9HYPH|nr:hemolysin III family protein [Hansschlegelia zhihuaiae]RXF66963.1 hemolysin III family protein [Hansschlegelia zhihuaiae]
MRGRFVYDRAELWADGVIHASGIVLALVGVVALVTFFAPASSSDLVPISVYCVGLLSVLVVSAAYNMWPVSPVKWWLRRCDHSAIFVLIAGTYTPFLARMSDGMAAQGMSALLWTAALAGILLKITRPGRYDRVTIGLYLAMGWSCVIIWDRVMMLPAATLWLLVAGGIFYTGGVVFHLWHRLRFHNAIWHACVLVATAFHYAAVVSLVAAPGVVSA